MSPSSTWSFTPVTVTVCATFQSAAVNVRFATSTVPSATLLELTGITTSAAGWLSSTTVKLALPPASVVTRPETGVTVMPGTSSVVTRGVGETGTPRPAAIVADGNTLQNSATTTATM